MGSSFLAGLGLGLSLIVAIGAQNIWVLSQSMAGANRLVIALVCICCDVGLILLGIFGASLLNQWLPDLLPYLAWAGVLMLSYLAWQALQRVRRQQAGLAAQSVQVQHWTRTALTALAISLLNPHVYLDTVVLLGSIGAMQASPSGFALGACIASCVWFGSLTALAPRLKEWLSSARRWQLFDSAVAVILLSIAWQLAPI